MKRYYVHDYETLCNCFVGYFEDVYSNHNRIFVISETQNMIKDFIEFLEKVRDNKVILCGYNSLNFDSQITEYILLNKSFLLPKSGAEVAAYIYSYAQHVIDISDRKQKGEKVYLDFSYRNYTIQNVDIYKLNHWDSDAKRSSLKWIQFTMDWNNVQEMPYRHDIPIKNHEQAEIVTYCINDVKSTKNIFVLNNYEMMKQVYLRETLSDKYNIPLYSASEPTISKDIFLDFLSKELNEDKKTLSKKRTILKNVNINSVLLPYIDFNLPEFKAVHTWFKNLNVDVEKTLKDEKKQKGPKYQMTHKGVVSVFALGGLNCVASSLVILR